MPGLPSPGGGFAGNCGQASHRATRADQGANSMAYSFCGGGSHCRSSGCRLFRFESWPDRAAARGGLQSGHSDPQAGPAARPPAVFPASRAVSQLADLALPAFRLNNLRGETGNPAFVAGMKAYSRQDCMNAVTELSRVPAADRDSLAARFFGGICRMHQGDLDGAAKSLRA